MPTKPNKRGRVRESDEECQIMVMKMIQNLENKMELQINSLETRIEKMQERFNKDLEEIKKSQYIMNNAINEIKNTLEAMKCLVMSYEMSMVLVGIYPVPLSAGYSSVSSSC